MVNSQVKHQNNIKRLGRWLAIGALLCMLSVIIGAFAAHGLKSQLNEYQLGIVQTGAKYQMYHGLALIMYSILCFLKKEFVVFARVVNTAFLIGTILFSGSLYLLALTKISLFAYFTPLGGLAFIIAWCVFVWSALRVTAGNVHQSKASGE